MTRDWFRDSPLPLQEAVMARAYSGDLRARVLDAAAAGASARSAAARFGIGVSTAIAWIRRARRDGERSARRQGKPRGSRLGGHEAFVFAMIEAHKDMTLNEMVERLAAEREVQISRSTLSAWLRGRGWTFKTYGPPRLQEGSEEVTGGLRKRIRSREAVPAAKMEIRAPWSS